MVAPAGLSERERISSCYRGDVATTVAYLVGSFGLSRAESEDAVADTFARILDMGCRYTFNLLVKGSCRRALNLHRQRRTHQRLHQTIATESESTVEIEIQDEIPWQRLRGESRNYAMALGDGFSVSDCSQLFNVDRQRIYYVIRRDLGRVGGEAWTE